MRVEDKTILNLWNKHADDIFLGYLVAIADSSRLSDIDIKPDNTNDKVLKLFIKLIDSKLIQYSWVKWGPDERDDQRAGSKFSRFTALSNRGGFESFAGQFA